MRKKDDTLRQTLLDLSRDIVNTDGADALSIRVLAKKAGVASGTVYNYFENKDEILLVLTEEYWRRTLIEMRSVIQAQGFTAQLREIYAFLQSRVASSAGMLMSSLGNVESAGRLRMQSMQQVLRTAIIERIRADGTVRQDVWSPALTEEAFADFIIMNMMVLLRMNAPNIDSFIEIIKRVLYKGD